MPRHPLNALTTLDRSHCQCSSFSRRPEGTRQMRLPFTITPIHNAIDVFDRSAYAQNPKGFCADMELRRAARLQSIFKTSFSRLDPIPRGQATVIRLSIRSPQRGPTTTIQSDKLPSYLQPFTHIRPARPSMGSSELGSDASNNLTVAQNTWKPPDQSSLHNVCRTRTRLKSRCKTLFSSEDILSVSTNSATTCAKPVRLRFQASARQSSTSRRLVELSGIEPLTPCLQSRCSPS